MRCTLVNKYPRPVQFDGAKFARRYKLDSLKGEFWADENFIYVTVPLPDDPPIMALSDPPKENVKDRIERANISIELKEILKELV